MTDLATKEHDLARAWRESHKLTQREVGELTGYSRATINYFESGRYPNGPIPDANWRTYRAACAAVDITLRFGRHFNWSSEWSE